MKIKTTRRMSIKIKTTRVMSAKAIMNTKGKDEEECEGGDNKEGGKAEEGGEKEWINR